MLVVILLLLFTFIIYLYVKWVRVKQYWAKRGVSYIPPHPVFGSMTFLLKESAASWFRRMYNYCKEPYMGIWIFWRPTLLVNSTEIARNILIRDQANFRNRFATSGTTDPVGRLTLFTLNDPLWSLIRRPLMSFFSGSKLRGVHSLMTKKSNELVERIQKDRLKPEPINLRNLMSDFTTDIIGTSSFGVVSNATLTGSSYIKTVSENLMNFDIFRGLSWFSGFFIPELVDFFRFKWFPTETTDQLRMVLRDIIAQRGGLKNKVSEPRDLLDYLIKIKQEAGEELDVTENMMIAQIIVFLQGGFDTTATSLTFVIYELAFCPEAQEKLYKELQDAKDKFGDDLIDASTLAELTYLNCVINEGLRKYLIIAWLDRVAHVDYKVDDHLTIRAGTPVYVNVVGIHYDPEFYPEPERFDPDRFLPKNKTDMKPFVYIPFGEGPRKCIGQRFGLSAIRHALAAIILNFQVRFLPNSPKPVEVEIEKKGLLTIPENILSVEFVPRKGI